MLIVALQGLFYMQITKYFECVSSNFLSSWNFTIHKMRINKDVLYVRFSYVTIFFKIMSDHLKLVYNLILIVFDES